MAAEGGTRGPRSFGRGSAVLVEVSILGKQALSLAWDSAAPMRLLVPNQSGGHPYVSVWRPRHKGTSLVHVLYDTSTENSYPSVA